MFFLPLGIDGATSSFKAPLVVLQDRTGNCPIQTKRKQRRLPELLSIYWVHLWKADFWNAMHIHSDFLTTSSPAEGRVRSIGGNCSRWRMRTSCVVCFGFDGVFRLTDFGTCQYEVATCGEAEIWNMSTWFRQICANPTETFFLQKPVLTSFFYWTYNGLGLWSSWYIYIYL